MRPQVVSSAGALPPLPSRPLAADHAAQNLYLRENLEEFEFDVDSEWQDYSATFTAPDGTWQTYVILKSAAGELEFDNVRLVAL